MDSALDFLPDIPDFLSDLIAGFVGTAVIGAIALLARRVDPERGSALLRRVGWPIMAFVFLAAAFASALLRGASGLHVLLLALVAVTVFALLAVAKFTPWLIRLEVVMAGHVWQIVAAVFFVSTVTLLFVGDDPPELEGQIVFVVSMADEELIVLRDVLDEVEQELGFKVFLMNVDASRYVARLSSMAASGNTRWDLIATDNNTVGVLCARQLVEELTTFIARDELVPSTLLPSLRPLLVCEDRFYFAPFRPNVKIAYYDEQRFALRGLEFPKTMLELLNVARTFYQQEGRGRVAIQGFPGPAAAVTAFEFITAFGGDPLSLGDKESKDAFMFLQALEPYLAPQYVETRFDTANELLIEEQVYLVMNWTFGIKVVVEDAGKTAIRSASGWRGPRGEFHVLGGDVLGIPKGSRNPEKAAELLKLLLSKEVQQTLFDRLRWLPVRSDAYAVVSPELAPYFEAVRDAVGHAGTRPKDPQWTLAERVLADAFEGLVVNREPIECLDLYADRMAKIPSDYVLYTVALGETITSISTDFNTTVQIMAQANGITPTTAIGLGQILLVPDPDDDSPRGSGDQALSDWDALGCGA